MNLRRTRLTVLGLVALPLTLAGCTQPAPPTQSEESVVRITSADDPVLRAMARVYVDQLEARGFKSKLVAESSKPYELLEAGDADVVVGTAETALQLVPDPETVTGEDGVLNTGELADLAQALESQGRRTADPTAGDAGPVLVASKATMAQYSLASLDDLASTCKDLVFLTPSEQREALEAWAKEAKCTPKAIKGVAAAAAMDSLRSANGQLAVLEGDDAAIVDEGFNVLPGSGDFFDRAPILPVVSDEVSEQALRSINDISSSVSQDALTAVNRMVYEPGGLTSEDIAAHWEQLVN
ncbi:hypothetical protein GCM10027417_03640 [Glutamicibacter endophyticus]